MSATDQEVRKLYVNEELFVDSSKKILFRDTAIYIYSDADGYLRIVADTGIKLDSITTMQTGKQLNAAADGVVTFTKAGAIADADFTTDTSGLIAIDTTNDRIYFKTAASEDWHYCTKDAGLSFPETHCEKCGVKFKKGDAIKMIIDGFATDGAPHSIPVHEECI